MRILNELKRRYNIRTTLVVWSLGYAFVIFLGLMSKIILVARECPSKLQAQVMTCA